MDTNIIEVETKALTLPEKARAIVVLDQETFKSACEFREVIKAIQKEINDTFDPIISKAYASHKEAVAQKKKAEAPLVEAKNIIEPNISQYLAEMERIRKKEEARLQEIARKAEEEALLAEAVALEAMGEKEQAEEIINEPVRAAPVVLPKANLNSGINMRETWSAEVIDLIPLIMGIVSGIVPRQAVEANMIYLNGRARVEKSGMNIPGVKAVSKKSIY